MEKISWSDRVKYGEILGIWNQEKQYPRLIGLATPRVGTVGNTLLKKI